VNKLSIKQFPDKTFNHFGHGIASSFTRILFTNLQPVFVNRTFFFSLDNTRNRRYSCCAKFLTEYHIGIKKTIRCLCFSTRCLSTVRSKYSKSCCNTCFKTRFVLCDFSIYIEDCHTSTCIINLEVKKPWL